jgi:glycosyltransferase involved in cell wall biosynthesis
MTSEFGAVLPSRDGTAQALGPAVSVIIATYNRATFLRETIESILQQTFQGFELIVVDDGSTDDTRTIVERFGPRIQYYYQPNQGPAAARNYGVRRARAPWIAFQDSDDICSSDHLESLFGYVREHPECGMAFGNGAYLEGPQHDRETIIPKRKSQRFETNGVHLIDLFEKSVVRLQAAIISTRAYESVGGMDASLRICDDLDLFFRLCMRYPIKYLNRVVFFYRKHQGNLSRNEELRLTENIKVIENLLRAFPEAREMIGAGQVARRIAYRYYRLAKGRWNRNELPGAMEAIDAAISQAPYSLKYRAYRYRWRIASQREYSRG